MPKRRLAIQDPEELRVSSVPSGPRVSLEEMRRRRLLTQSALARAAGLHVSTVQAIEHGAIPRYGTIQKLCAALHCRPEEIEWPGNPLRLGPVS